MRITLVFYLSLATNPTTPFACEAPSTEGPNPQVRSRPFIYQGGEKRNRKAQDSLPFSRMTVMYWAATPLLHEFCTLHLQDPQLTPGGHELKSAEVFWAYHYSTAVAILSLTWSGVLSVILDPCVGLVGLDPTSRRWTGWIMRGYEVIDLLYVVVSWG